MLLFLEANSQELIRRYAATRRPHPLEREGMLFSKLSRSGVSLLTFFHQLSK